MNKIDKQLLNASNRLVKEVLKLPVTNITRDVRLATYQHTSPQVEVSMYKWENGNIIDTKYIRLDKDNLDINKAIKEIQEWGI